MIRVYYEGPTGRLGVQVFDGNVCDAVHRLADAVYQNPYLTGIGVWYCAEVTH